MVVNGTVSKIPGQPGTVHLEVQHENGTRYLFTVVDIGRSDLFGTREGTLAITWWCWHRGGATQQWASCPTREEVRAAFCMRTAEPDDRDPPMPQGGDLDAVYSIIRSIFGVRT